MYLTKFDEMDDRFYIKESLIKDAGNGLFARCAISKGEKIDITGVLVERGSRADICTTFANPYKFASNIIEMADGTFEPSNKLIIPLGFSGIVNHIGDESKMNVQITYFGNDNIAYMFIKDVQKNEEILGNYGKEWQKLLEWSQKQKENDKTDKNDWEKFLSLNLYNLGDLL